MPAAAKALGFSPPVASPPAADGTRAVDVAAAWCGDETACRAFTSWALDAARERMGHHDEWVRSWRDLTEDHRKHGQVERFNLDACGWWVVCEDHDGASWWRGVTRAEWLQAARAALDGGAP